jgi:formylglycine-generating enzyme required for sulfatase activity
VAPFIQNVSLFVSIYKPCKFRDISSTIWIMKYQVTALSILLLLVTGCLSDKPSRSEEPKAPETTPATEPPNGESFSVSEINLDMLWCKPGTFMMGSSEGEKDRRKDETQHEVTLTQGFYLGKYEVTQEQWEKVMGENPSYHKGAALPVEKVSWDDAMQFCQKLTVMEKTAGRLPEGWVFTLPTEAQWEFACRAGTTTAYFFGDVITPKQANYERNVGKTTPVGTYPANAWGFHDMHGNVIEWCRDWYGDYPDGSVSDPQGPSDGSKRVYRGGVWSNGSRGMRSADRGGFTPDTGASGFRLSLQTEKTE